MCCNCVFVVVVVNRSGTATLTCGPEATGAVRWKFKDRDLSGVLEYLTSVDPVSHSLTVTNVDTHIVGEYSCWMGEKKLMSTYLLLEQEEGSVAGKISFIHNDLPVLVLYNNSLSG